MQKKNRVIELGGRRYEIIGATVKCRVLVNDASHPAFWKPFSSIRAATSRIKQHAANLANSE